MKQKIIFLAVLVGVGVILLGVRMWQRERAALALVSVGSSDLEKTNLLELPNDFDDLQVVATPVTTPIATPSVPVDSGDCQRTGCSGQLCLASDQAADLGVTTCEYQPHYDCYQLATCERQPSGQCGFTPTPKFTSCLLEKGAPTTPLPATDFINYQVAN